MSIWDEVYTARFLKAWVTVSLIVSASLVASTISYPLLRDTVVGQTIEDQLRQVLDMAQSEGQSLISLPLLIILNNMQVALIIALLSPTLILSLGLEAFQGAVVGYFIPMILYGALNTGQIVDVSDPLFVFYGLVIHGVVEIPAIALVAAPVILARTTGIRKAFTNSVKLIPHAFILLAIAGIVESTITVVVVLLIALVKLVF